MKTVDLPSIRIYTQYRDFGSPRPRSVMSPFTFSFGIC